MQLELVAPDRAAQVGFERMARARLRLHLDVEQAAAIAPFRLGAVEREIGILQQLVRVVAVLRGERHADAGADGELVARKLVGLAHGGEQAIREGQRRFALVVAGALQDRELVAAEPRHQIGLARAADEPLRGLLQQCVADRMAERVVHRLELIEVEDEHVEPLAVPVQARERLLDRLEEQHAVGEAGQRVMMRHVIDLRLGLLALRDVDDDAENVFRLAVRIRAR